MLGFAVPPPPPSSQITLPTTLCSQSKTRGSLFLLPYATPLPPLVSVPNLPTLILLDAQMQVWLILTPYTPKQACSKQGSPDMQPWTGGKLLFVSLYFMAMYFAIQNQFGNVQMVLLKHT